MLRTVLTHIWQYFANSREQGHAIFELDSMNQARIQKKIFQGLVLP